MIERRYIASDPVGDLNVAIAATANACLWAVIAYLAGAGGLGLLTAWLAAFVLSGAAINLLRMSR